MKVVKIGWIDVAEDRALLIVSDGKYEVEVLSDPCPFRVGDSTDEVINANGLSEIVQVALRESNVEDASSYGLFGKSIVAKVLDSKNGIVGVGDLRIALDTVFSSAVSDGDFVQFKVMSLELSGKVETGKVSAYAQGNSRIARIEVVDEPSREAVVTVTDGTYLINTFSCPCMLHVGDSVKCVRIFMPEQIKRVLPQPMYAKRNPSIGYYDQDVIARVVNARKGIAAIGEILMSLGVPFSDDISDGDFVSLIAGRLDCW